ncbi:alpha/beta fold hydrolase [Actinomycetospora sp. CA-053990]|uniref:alpha/beta fold hydrolase n=1 Tax=Actinomycetospora sp. CA-053990 TaxID=3239891 RepID=UPI003D8C712D
MRRSRVRVGAVVIALTVVLAACSSAQGETGPAAGPADFAGLVDVGGRNLYLECHGSGSPTVVLQSGFPNAADIWSVGVERPPSVMQGVAAFARVCAYDRPGSTRISTPEGLPADQPTPGRSDQAPMPRTAADVVAELHALLAAAGVPGPYVVVGHSLGGLFSQLYAQTYPADVAGVVLVDPTPPAVRDLLPPALWESFAQSVERPESPVPGYTLEAYDLTASTDQVRDAPAPPRVPATILVAGAVDPVPPGDPSAEAIAAIERVRPEAYARLAQSIPGSQLVTVPDTTHYIQILRPDVVIGAVRSAAGR